MQVVLSQKWWQKQLVVETYFSTFYQILQPENLYKINEKLSVKKGITRCESFISFTMISLTIDQGSYIIANYTKMTLLILQSLSTLFVSQPCSHFCILQLEMVLFHLQNVLYLSTTCCLSKSELVC